MNNTNNLQPYAAQSYTQTLVVNLICLTFGFLALIGNAFILFTIGTNPKLHENLYNLIIGVLAFADLWAGIGYSFGNIAKLTFQFAEWYNYTTGICAIIEVPMIFGFFSSQIATLFIAIDRLKAVRDPVGYSTQDRSKGFFLAFAVTETFSFVTTCFVFVGIDFNSYPAICSAGSIFNKYYIMYINLFAAVVAITVFTLYLTTSRILAKQMASVKNSGINSELGKQNNIFKTIKIVLFVYGTCGCLPNIIAVIVERLTSNPAILGQIFPIVAVGTGLNSSLNVIIYARKHKELGTEMRKVFSNAKETITMVQTLLQEMIFVPRK